MYELAPVNISAHNQELARISPYSGVNVLNHSSSYQGGFYPWYGNSETGLGVPESNRALYSSFGKTNKKHTGWCVTSKGKILKIYKIKGLRGKRLYNRKKVPKSARCYKTKKAAERYKAKNKKNAREHVGWCIKKNRAVKIYKFSGITGKRYYDKKKVPKRTRCYKSKRTAQNAIGTRRRKSKKKNSESTRKWLKKILNKNKNYYYTTTSRKPTIKERGDKLKGALKRRGLPCSQYKSKSSCDLKAPRCKWDVDKCKGRYGNAFGRVINPANRFNYNLQQYATNVGTPNMKQLHNVGQTPAYQYPVSTSNHAWYVPKENLSGYGF